MHAGLVTLSGQIFVFPGGTFDATKRSAVNTSAVWRYTIVTREWKAIAPYPFAVRGLAASALDERFILLVGGYETPPNVSAPPALTNECFLYDIVTDRYLPAPPCLMRPCSLA